MNGKQTKQDDEKLKQISEDERLKPISIEDLVAPTGELQKTSPRREWEIKKLMEKLGVSREIAEKMVDEAGFSE